MKKLVTTRAQREALKRCWLHQAPAESYLTWRRRFRWSGVGSDLYLFGQVPAGFWLGIERDGYAHS